MKSLKLKKVKISSIRNPHNLFGGNTTVRESEADTCQIYTYDLNCKTKDLDDADCNTVTNSIPTNRTDPYQHTNACDGLGG